MRPRVIVALGATAALAVFGKATPIGKFRQQAIQLPDQGQGVVTYHPSYLLRVPDAEAKAKAWRMFVEDLGFAWKLANYPAARNPASAKSSMRVSSAWTSPSRVRPPDR